MRLGRFLLAGVVGLLAGAVASTSAVNAQSYPSKPIKLVVWGSPGSGTDVFGRSLAPLVAEGLGASVVVENKPGGAGAVAMRYIESQPADGYTVLVVTASMIPLVVRDNIEMPRIVNIAGETPLFFAVKGDSRFKTMQDVLDYARQNPGKLTIGKALSGGTADQIAHDFIKSAGIDAVSIPYQGTAEVQQAILSGEVDVGIAGSPSVPQVTAGALTALAVASDQRLDSLPDTPTLAELGLDTPARLWRAIAVRKGTPDDVVHKLYDAFEKAFATEQFMAGVRARNEMRTTIPEERVQNWVENQVEPTREFLRALGLL